MGILFESLERVGRVAAHKDHLQIREAPAQRLEGLAAGESRHGGVQHQQVDRAAAPFGRRQGFHAVGGLEDEIAGAPEDGRADMA